MGEMAKFAANHKKNHYVMFKKFFFSIATATLLFACGTTPTDTTAQTGEPQSFGEKITADGAITHAEMLAKLAGADSVQVKFTGKVEGVCQAKGCWMNISDGTAGNDVFVKFVDYGFFMPKDIAGRDVIMEGWAYREITPVDELRHYAEDEGLSQEEIEKITEPKEELKFMASGVLLMPESKQ